MFNKMVATCVDVVYSFDELEEYAKEMILYDIRTKLNITEEEAVEIAKRKQYNYLATINYEISKTDVKMKPWEHCAKKFYSIDIALAMENIKNNSIVKCKIGDAQYLFNLPGEKNTDITTDMISKGEWYVYTWAD